MKDFTTNLNPLSEILRELRLKHNHTTQRQVELLNYSMSHISATNTYGFRSPLDTVRRIEESYDITPEMRERLVEAALWSHTNASIKLNNMTLRQRKCALSFTKSFPRLSNNDLLKIQSILDKYL